MPDQNDITQKLQTSDAWLQRAVIAIYNLQAQAEQSTMTTCYLNGAGYNRTDARIMSGFAQQILATGRALTPGN